MRKFFISLLFCALFCSSLFAGKSCRDLMKKRKKSIERRFNMLGFDQYQSPQYYFLAGQWFAYETAIYDIDRKHKKLKKKRRK